MYAHLHYVVVVLPASMSTPEALPLSAISKPGPRQRKLTTDTTSLSNVLSSSSAGGATGPDAARVVLIDTENKMIAYVEVFERGIRDIVSAWGSVYIMGNNGSVRIF